MGLEERANTMIGVSGAFLAIAWIAFSLRAFVKGYIMRSWGLDDWLMVVAISVFTVDSGLLITIGRQLTDVENASVFVTYQVFQFAFYNLANVFLKASLAITFDRILLERWQRIVVQVVVGIHTAFGLATFFVTIFRCGNPMDFYSRFPHAQCISWDAMTGVQYTNSTINTVTDWLLTLLPIFALRKMQMNHQAKISAAFILVLGCISSIISMPRFGFLHGLGGTGNVFWANAFPVAVLAVAEVGTGVTAACLLTLRPLIRTWRERSNSAPQSPRMDEMEEAEFGEAKAVSIRSVSASSASVGSDSIHKVKSIPAPIVFRTTEITPSPQISPVGSFMRRRSSSKAPDDTTPSEEIPNPMEEVAPQLSHQITADSGARPWQKPVAAKEVKKTPRDRKRLTWNDVHAQWSSMHVSRAAYHGKPKNSEKLNDGEKPKRASRVSLKRLTMLFPDWDTDKE